MQQRQLRLGDIVDDYCPRERRVTNHAVVALVDAGVKQTRCTTCDAEHEFKQARVPTLRKKKEAVSTAYGEVLASVAGASAPAARDGSGAAEASAVTPSRPAREALEASDASEAPEASEDSEAAENGTGETEEQRVHRRLIRATLPRPENQPSARPVPQFTMREPTGRAGKFRGGPARGGASRAGVGHGPGSGSSRTPVFGRSAGNRGSGPGGRPPGRSDSLRPSRGGPPARHGKKHSK